MRKQTYELYGVAEAGQLLKPKLTNSTIYFMRLGTVS